MYLLSTGSCTAIAWVFPANCWRKPSVLLEMKRCTWFMLALVKWLTKYEHILFLINLSTFHLAQGRAIRALRVLTVLSGFDQPHLGPPLPHSWLWTQESVQAQSRAFTSFLSSTGGVLVSSSAMSMPRPIAGHGPWWSWPQHIDWLSCLTLGLSYHYGPARWSLGCVWCWLPSLDPTLTYGLTSQLGLRPASLPQMSLAIWTSWCPLVRAWQDRTRKNPFHGRDYSVFQIWLNTLPC